MQISPASILMFVPLECTQSRALYMEAFYQQLYLQAFFFYGGAGREAGRSSTVGPIPIISVFR